MQNLAVERLDVVVAPVVLQRDAHILQRIVALDGEGGIVGREDVRGATVRIQFLLPHGSLRVGGQVILYLNLTATQIDDVGHIIDIVVLIVFLTGLQHEAVG